MKHSSDDAIHRDNLKLRNTFREASPGLEDVIAGVFSRIMGVSPVGADDDFYDLGGDSLLGEQISMEILRVTGKVFPISGLFEHGTPGAIAAYLSSVPGEAPPTPSRETFFIVHGRGGYTALRPNFKTGIGSDARVVMFEFPGIRGDQSFPRSIPEVALAYVEQIERELPTGPVRLAAFCIGSLIAIEMASMLERRGRPLESLVLLDPGMPRSLVHRSRTEKRLDENPSSPTGRVLLFVHTGRVSRDSPGMEALWITARAAVTMVESIAKRIRYGFLRLRRGNVVLSDWPRAWLIASYRHVWPHPLRLPCHILASRTFDETYREEDGAWHHLLPNRRVHLIVEKHQDILAGNSAHVAAAMEALLLGRDTDLTIAAAPSVAPRFEPATVVATGGPATAAS